MNVKFGETTQEQITKSKNNSLLFFLRFPILALGLLGLISLLFVFLEYAPSYLTVRAMNRQLIIAESPDGERGGYEDVRITNHFRNLVIRDPAEDAKACFKVGDHRYISVGLSVVPGVDFDSDLIGSTKNLRGYGTTMTPLASQMSERAYRYAESYNKTLEGLRLEHIESSQ